MHDLYRVLRQKEMDCERVRREIQALQFVIPLLAEDTEREAAPVSTLQSRRNGSGGTKGWSAGREPFSI
jgi:hypothetical protein